MKKIAILSILFLINFTILGKHLVDRVEVEVNDQIITLSDINKEISNLKLKGRNLTGFETPVIILSDLLQNPAVQRDLGKKKFMTEVLIIDKLIEAEANRVGISISNYELEQLYQSILTRNNATKDQFINELSAQGMDVDSFMEGLKKRGIFEKVKQKLIFPKIGVSDLELENYYNIHYKKKRGFKVAYLYIRENKNSSKEVKEGNQKRLTAIADQLKSDTPFEEIVKQYTDGPYKDEGGVLNWMKEGSLEESLEEAIFEIKKGEVTPPLKTDNGYHMFKLIDMRYEAAKPFSELRSEIYQILAYKKWHSVFVSWLDELKSRGYIEYKNRDNSGGFSWSEWYNSSKSIK